MDSLPKKDDAEERHDGALGGDEGIQDQRESSTMVTPIKQMLSQPLETFNSRAEHDETASEEPMNICLHVPTLGDRSASRSQLTNIARHEVSNHAAFHGPRTSRRLQRREVGHYRKRR
eukprot:6841264-Pyramimonas_sp.AAC.1